MHTFKATEFTAVDKDGVFTQAETETLAWMAEGKENSCIAMLRGHGLPGAKKLVHSVMEKLHANTRTLAISRAFVCGYLQANDIKATLKRTGKQLVIAVAMAISGWALQAQDTSEVARRVQARNVRIVRIGRPGNPLEANLNLWLEPSAC